MTVIRVDGDLVLDFDNKSWQTIYIKWDREIAGAIGKISIIVFHGHVEGSVFIDNIRLVAQSPGNTAVLENYTSSKPSAFTLKQNYPNPFNSDTIIRFAVPNNQHRTGDLQPGRLESSHSFKGFSPGRQLHHQLGRPRWAATPPSLRHLPVSPPSRNTGRHTEIDAIAIRQYILRDCLAPRSAQTCTCRNVQCTPLKRIKAARNKAPIEEPLEGLV